MTGPVPWKGCNINKSEKRVPTKAKENDIHWNLEKEIEPCWEPKNKDELYLWTIGFAYCYEHSICYYSKEKLFQWRQLKSNYSINLSHQGLFLIICCVQLAIDRFLAKKNCITPEDKNSLQKISPLFFY